MDTNETIKQEINKLLSLMGYICVEETQVKEKEGRIAVTICVDAPYEIIGEQGRTLSAFQHVARLCVARKLPAPAAIDIDINNYRKRREEFLKDLARQAGERARFSRQPYALEPMSPFDRRVIHCTVAEYSDIISESAGEGFFRHVIIRPYP